MPRLPARRAPPHALAAWFALRKHQRALRTAASCERLLVASDFMRRELIAAGVEPERVALVPYFTRSNTPRLPASELDAATAIFIARGTSALLAAARLVPEKGIDRFVAALAAMRTPVRAVIAGSGPVEDDLQRQSRAAGLDERVHFAGWQSAGAIERLFASASAVVFPRCGTSRSAWSGSRPWHTASRSRPSTPAACASGSWTARPGCWRRAATSRVSPLALDELASQRERASALGAAGRARAKRSVLHQAGITALERELARSCRARASVRRP
jgi:hypothetical protein